MQHSAASSAQVSPGQQAPMGVQPFAFQPNLLAQVEDMLISPRFDTHSPHYRPFPDLQETDTLETDVCKARDQNRAKPRFSSTSLPDVDW